MDNPFTGLEAGLGGLFGQGQSQQFGQQQLQHPMSGINPYTTGSGGTRPNTAISAELQPPNTGKKKGPETAVAWLDRRVEEMRVKL